MTTRTGTERMAEITSVLRAGNRVANPALAATPANPALAAGPANLAGAER